MAQRIRAPATRVMGSIATHLVRSGDRFSGSCGAKGTDLQIIVGNSRNSEHVDLYNIKH